MKEYYIVTLALFIMYWYFIQKDDNTIIVYEKSN